MKNVKLFPSSFKALLFIMCLLGLTALTVNDGFAQNTNYGTGAGNSGNYNTSIGYQAGDVVTNDYNTFLGFRAGSNTSTGRFNTFLGGAAGHKNVSGSYNSYIGQGAGYQNTSGYANNFMGHNAGYNNTAGYHNTFLGHYTGYYNTSGDNNTFLGKEAGYRNSTGNGNLFLGHQAGYYETGSNKLYIENSSATVPLIYGDFSANAVGINTKSVSGYTLSVNGKIRATEVRVYTGWADYVFEDNYKLNTLEEVESYIKENGHLPDVPDANKVEADGILVGEMNATLLRKIEELTLYTIAQEKQIQTQNEINEKLLAKLEALEKQVNELSENK